MFPAAVRLPGWRVECSYGRRASVPVVGSVPEVFVLLLLFEEVGYGTASDLVVTELFS